MGQSATLYRINKVDFFKIIESPDDFELFEMTNGYEIFEQSFNGLQFILSKGLDKGNSDLIKQIFYPNTFVGEQVDFSKIDFENLPIDLDFEKQPVYYNAPDNVKKIYNVLDTITLDKFIENFDFKELNEKGIYPSGVWNDETENDAAFNIGHMSIEFENLISIIKSAKENGDYILSYIG